MKIEKSTTSDALNHTRLLLVATYLYSKLEETTATNPFTWTQKYKETRTTKTEKERKEITESTNTGNPNLQSLLVLLTQIKTNIMAIKEEITTNSRKTSTV